MLVTLDQAKEHLRVDFDDEDEYIMGLITTAETVIAKHVDVDDFSEGNQALRHAALLLIGYWNKNRDAEKEDSNGWYLPGPVLALLTPYRTPTAV